MVSGEICELPGCGNPRKVKPRHNVFVLVPPRMAGAPRSSHSTSCPLPRGWLGLHRPFTCKCSSLSQHLMPGRIRCSMSAQSPFSWCHCELLSSPHPHRFMVKQAENICRQATLQLRNNTTELQSWRALKEQLFNKFILRLVSCVQLASKLSFHYKVRSWVVPGHLGVREKAAHGWWL